MHAYLWCFSVLLKIVRPISGESSTKLPIWGHHTQIHRFYGIKRWNTMRKKNLFLVTPIPPWSRWPSDSGKLRVTKNKWIFNFTIVTIFWPKKPLGGDPYCIENLEVIHHPWTQSFDFSSNFDRSKNSLQHVQVLKRLSEAQRNRHVSYRLPYLVWYQVHVLGTTTGIVSIPRVPRTTCHVFLRIFLKKMKINLLC